MTVRGVGVDAVDVPRFRAVVGRRPRIAQRLFSDHERADARGVEGLAARFAAKEAAMKALGVGLGAFRLRDVEVARDERGTPSLVLRGTAAALAERRGVARWHLSLTHTASVAVALAVAESG